MPGGTAAGDPGPGALKEAPPASGAAAAEAEARFQAAAEAEARFQAAAEAEARFQAAAERLRVLEQPPRSASADVDAAGVDMGVSPQRHNLLHAASSKRVSLAGSCPWQRDAAVRSAGAVDAESRALVCGDRYQGASGSDRDQGASGSDRDQGGSGSDRDQGPSGSDRDQGPSGIAPVSSWDRSGAVGGDGKTQNGPEPTPQRAGNAGALVKDEGSLRAPVQASGSLSASSTDAQKEVDTNSDDDDDRARREAMAGVISGVATALAAAARPSGAQRCLDPGAEGTEIVPVAEAVQLNERQFTAATARQTTPDAFVTRFGEREDVGINDWQFGCYGDSHESFDDENRGQMPAPAEHLATPDTAQAWRVVNALQVLHHSFVAGMEHRMTGDALAGAQQEGSAFPMAPEALEDVQVLALRGGLLVQSEDPLLHVDACDVQSCTSFESSGMRPHASSGASSAASSAGASETADSGFETDSTRGSNEELPHNMGNKLAAKVANIRIRAAEDAAFEAPKPAALREA
eukprot:gene12456-14720_t